MSNKGPGKHGRKGLSLIQIGDMFPDEVAARAWFVKRRWPNGPFCPHCGSFNVQSNIKHKTMTHRCRDCPKKPMFSLKTGTILEGTKLSYRVWIIAIYLVTTSLKGVASMKLHRDLDITQKSAWHLAHRLRKAMTERNNGQFCGPVEVDETYFGGQRRNMSIARRRALADTGHGAVGKTAVVGAKDRATKHVAAKVVKTTDKKTLHEFVGQHTKPGATVYTDDAKSYKGLPFKHESVKHSLSQYVKGDVHTNGIESLWSMLKRAHKGTFHKISPKHLDRYVQEFAGRHNVRESDTIDQMSAMVEGMERKRLRYKDLIR